MMKLLRTIYQVVSKMVEGPRDVSSFIIPAPTGGLNYKEALPLMSPDTAISMSNLIPNGATADVRGALRKWAEVGTSTSLKGLFTYKCSDRGEYLIGYGQYSTYDILYNLSSTTAAIIGQWPLSFGFLADIPDPAPTAINFGGYLFICTGAFSSIYTTGFATHGLVRIGPPTGAGGSFTSTDVTPQLTTDSGLYSNYILGTVGAYKNRLYMALGPSQADGNIVQKILYGNANQVAGAIDAANVYDVSCLTKNGGRIIFADSVTRQEGALSQSLFCVVTENGEVLVFQGSYPGSTTWEMVGYYVIPKPLGKRAFFYVGSSLYIITISGIFSFADLTNNYGVSSELGFTSDYINNNFPTYASYALTLNSLTSGVTSWYGTFYPRENKIFVGYPDSPSTYGMLVQDLTTKGWGQLNYQNQIAGLTVYKDYLYGFAPASYTYSLQSLNTHDEIFRDNKWSNSPISYSAQLAANYNEDFSTTKQFGEVKTLVQCTSPYSITCGLAVDFDLRSAGANNASHITGGTYGLYQPKFTTGDRENVGKCCILNIGGQATAADLPIKFVAFEVYYTEGGNW